MNKIFVVIDEIPSCCTFEDDHQKLDSIYDNVISAKARVKELNIIGEIFQPRILAFDLNTTEWEYYVDEEVVKKSS